MPLTNVGSYISTMLEHDEHWELVDVELGGSPETGLRLPGDFGRSDFQALLADLQTALAELIDLENERQLSASDRDAQKENIRQRVRQFRAMAQGQLAGTRYLGELPKTPRETLAEIKLLAALDEVAGLWARIDADTGLPDFTPPLLLAGNYGLAAFTADLAELRAASAAVAAAKRELDFHRQQRDAMLPTIRQRLGQYHDIVEGTFGQGHPLTGSLPNISPPSAGRRTSNSLQPEEALAQ